MPDMSGGQFVDHFISYRPPHWVSPHYAFTLDWQPYPRCGIVGTREWPHLSLTEGDYLRRHCHRTPDRAGRQSADWFNEEERERTSTARNLYDFTVSALDEPYPHCFLAFRKQHTFLLKRGFLCVSPHW